MMIDFTCLKCEGGFELEATDLIDGSEKLECPHCGVKATQAATDDFTSALADLKAQVAALSKKFTVSFEIDPDEIDAAEAPEEEDEEDEEDDLEDDDDDDDDDDLEEDVADED